MSSQPVSESKIATAAETNNTTNSHDSAAEKTKMKTSSGQQRTYASMLQQPAAHGRRATGGDHPPSRGSGPTVSKSLLIANERRPKSIQRKRMLNVMNVIIKEHGVSIEMQESDPNNLCVVVRGKTQSVDAAIDSILTQLTIPERVPMPDHIPAELLKLHSEYLKSLENDFDCRITVNTQNQIVNVFSSTNESAESAVNALNAFFEKLRDVTIETLNIPKIYHPWIRGPFGRTIKRIRQETETDITMPSLQDPRTEIIVTGTENNVTRASACIHQAYKNQVAHLTAMTHKLTRPELQMLQENNFLNVDHILEKTNVYVELPLQNMSSEVVILRGCRNEDIGDACSMITALMNTSVEEHIEVPPVLVNLMRAKLSAVRYNLQSVNIDMSRSAIIVKGSPQNVSRAVEYLNKIIAQLMTCIAVDTMEVDKQYYTNLFRRERRKLQQYYANHGVIVKQGENGTKILLEGEPDKIEIVKKDIAGSAERAKNEIVRSLKVDREFHGKIIGSRGSKIQEIKSLFDVNISVPNAEENKDEIVLRGLEEEVERCARYIKDFVDDMKQSDYMEEISVPKVSHRLIIGHRGSKIQEIRRATNAIIEIPSPEDPSCFIRVRGSPHEVKAAKQYILAIVDSRVEESIKIPLAAQLHMTKNNQLLDSLRRQCGNVQINRAPEEKSGKFIIRGSRADVTKAMEFLQSEIDRTLEHTKMKEVPVSSLQKSFIMNNCNEFMTQLATDYNVVIEPSVREKEQIVFQFCGEPDQVDSAVELFNQELEKIGEIVEKSVKVPIAYHPRFLRRNLGLLQELKDAFSVEIIMPSHRSSNENFLLRGNESSVAKAEDKIMELIEGWKDETSIEVPCSFVGYLQSNARTLVNPIEFECNVQIEFPDIERVEQGTAEQMLYGIAPDHVIVKGTSANCEAAQRRIEACAPTEISVDVPRQYHARIIGRQGTEISRIKRDSGVTEIIVPQRGSVHPNDQSPPILVRGNAESVEKARQMIMAIVDNSASSGGQSRNSSFVPPSANQNDVTIDLPKHLHPRLIGRGGKTINRLRQEYNVEISVPPLGSDLSDTLIHLRGSSEDCERARQEIEKLRDDVSEGGESRPRPTSRFATRFNRPGMAVSKQAIIDPNAVPRLIGTKGRSINKFREQYHVEVKFNSDANNPDLVVVSGNTEELVDDAIEALIQLSTDDGSTYEAGPGTGGDHYAAGRSSAAAADTGGRRPPPDTSDLNEFPSF